MPPTLRNRIKSKPDVSQVSDEQPIHKARSRPDLTESAAKSIGFVIGPDLVDPDPMSELEKAKRKESIVIQSLRRRAQQETQRIMKEDELAKKRELDR